MSSTSAAGYLAPGTLVAGNYRYQIVNEIGRGAMAVVYLAKQVDLQRPVALKVLSLELSSNRSFVKRFFNEVRTAAALSHPNIIQAYDAGIANGDIYYFAMEYVRGETLLERITREQCLKVPAALKYAIEIANALDYGWQGQRLTHGDIKPDNIMVNDLDQAKLADFGLAKVTGHEYEGHELMLTPHYASPELINGKNPKNDCRADIYAFGASMYHLLAGSPPYPGNDGQEVMRRHLREELEPLAQRKPGIPIQLSDFIGRMLAKDPAARPANWNAVLEELDRCEKGLSRSPEDGRIVLKLPPERARVKVPAAAAPAAPVRPRISASTWLLLGIVLASILLFVFGFLYWRKLRARQESDKGVTVTYKEPEQSSAAAGEKITASSGGLPVQPAPAVLPPQENAPSAATTEPVQAQQVPSPAQPSQGSLPTPPVASQETPVESTAPAKTEPTAVNSGEKEPAPAVVKVSPTSEAPRMATFPDYSLRPDFTRLQKKSFALLQAWQIFASFRHIPGQLGSAERMMVALNDWLSQHGPDGTGFELVQFVKTDVVPLMDEGPAKLALNKNAVLGRTFRSRGKKSIQLVVRDVYPDGILADWQLEKGTMQRRVTWRELEDTQTNILLDMYKVAFFDNTVNGNPEFYLAQLVFSNYSRNQPAVPTLSQTAVKNRSNWERLFEMTNLSDARDREALKLLSELSGLCARGSRIEAGRAARRLLSLNSTLANQYRDLPEAVMAVCGKYLPDIRGGQLVRQAQDLLNEHPEQALGKLNAATVLYGQVKFPEQEQIGKLQNRASRRLADSLSRSEVNLAAAWPFVNVRPAGVSPCRGYAQVQILEKEALASKTELSALRALVNMEAGVWPRKGDWLSAEDMQAIYAANEPLSSAAARYASWLLELRCGQWVFPEHEEFLRGLPRAQYGSLPHSLLLQLCLLSRQADAAQQGAEKLLQPLYVWSRGEPSQLPDRWRLLLSLLLEAGHYDDVRQVLGMVWYHIEQKQDIAIDQAFKEERKKLSLMMRQNAENTVPKAKFSLPAELPVSEYQLRFRLAALLQQPLNDSADASMRTFLSSAGGGLGQVGGDALFDWLLRRVAWELQNGDVKGAYELCEQLLELELPCLLAYLPRIYFLQTGLLLLNGQTAGLTDAYHALRFGSIASEEQELRVLEQSRNGEIQITAGDIKTPSGPYFWLEWLRCCMSLGGEQTETARKYDLQTVSSSCFNAEKALLAGLETYSRTFLPVSSGKEK
jgi:serine/threonine protein kinase